MILRIGVFLSLRVKIFQIGQIVPNPLIAKHLKQKDFNYIIMCYIVCYYKHKELKITALFSFVIFYVHICKINYFSNNMHI